MDQPPVGTVTFLFTDIQGSTKLWQKYPADMPDALSRHHNLLHQAIGTNGGYVFQIIGDAFCAAFHTALDGLQAALAAQQALKEEPWGVTGPIKVRMALHTGNAQVQAGEYTSGEYVSGLTLSRAARLLSAGHGGQILLSLSTAELVRDHLPDGTDLRDLGVRRLKDLVRPEHIYMATVPDLPGEFPPLKTLDARPNNLPAQFSNFIGREKEMEQVRLLLAKNRLVTLTGPGGTGKTRLSLQVGAELIENFEHGVWFVELASLSEGSFVLQRLASVMGIQEEPGSNLLELLVRFMRNMQTLIILDNCEHLVQACAQLAVHLIQAAPRVQILASSLERLHVSGEVVYPVAPLSIPDPHQRFNVEKMNASDAARLFIDRAIAIQPDFHLTDANAPAVAEICTRLDGSPLAIELAAARVRSLPVEKIANRLSDRFRLLTQGDLTAMPRHRTLGALIDWSYGLLSEPERAVLMRLSVFHGGWTLEAAEAICPGPDVNELDVLDLLSNLVEKSLVELSAETDRYRMLETVRQYAGEKLASDPSAETYRRAHYCYFLQFVEKAEPELTGPDHAVWIQRMDQDFDNVRAALRWALDSGHIEKALHLGFAIGRYWYIGDFSEGRAWLEQALGRRETASQRAQAEGLFRAGELAFRQGALDTAKEYLHESLAIAHQLGYDSLMASALDRLGFIIYRNEDAILGRQMLEEARLIYQRIDNKRSLSVVLLHLGTLSDQEGDVLQAENYLQQSLELSRETRELWVEGSSLSNIGLLKYIQGDIEAAQILIEKAYAVQDQLKSKIDKANVQSNLALVAVRKGEQKRARDLLIETLTIRQSIGNLSDLLSAFSGLASVLRLEGQSLAAAKLQGFVAAGLERLDGELEPVEQIDFDDTTSILTSTLGEDEYRRAFVAGRSLSLEQAQALVGQ